MMNSTSLGNLHAKVSALMGARSVAPPSAVYPRPTSTGPDIDPHD